jgi:predicted nucleic acid-binding protein
MHFAKSGGQPMQDLLWGYVDRNALRFHDLTRAEQERMRELMRKYRDTPMDMADASIVAAAETLGVNRVFTLDGDFHIYRIHGRQPFEVIR